MGYPGKGVFSFTWSTFPVLFSMASFFFCGGGVVLVCVENKGIKINNSDIFKSHHISN